MNAAAFFLVGYLVAPMAQHVEDFSCQRPILERPLQNVSTGSPYGHRRHPISGKWRLHTGLDLPTHHGAPVAAAAGGIVTLHRSRGGYGRMIRIAHGNGWETMYAHLSHWEHNLQNGSVVTQGQIIGHVGSSGAATGPHLHYEVRLSGQPLNPESEGCKI